MYGKDKIKKTPFLFFSILFLFVSCEFNEPVRNYLEYWSSTCQVGKIEYETDYVEINDVPNLSALNEIEISLYTVNPKELSLLKKNPSFSFTLDDGSPAGSSYAEEMLDPTHVRIRTTLSDATEGEQITLSGCLWPENRVDFTADQLFESSPELFYTTSFIQNTPPDNIKNLQRAEDFFPGTQKCYIAFEVPDQSLNRNKDSTYEVKYFFRNDDNSLELKGSKILTLADNKNPTAGSNVFLYYFDGQLDGFLSRYEYTVQMTGPHGLTVDLRSTDPALGACVLVESAITVLDAPNGLYDEDSDGDYECYELESEEDCITFTAEPGQEGDTLTVTDNGTVLTLTNGNTYTVSGLGRHEIRATSSRTDAFSVTVKKRLRIEVTPNPATFTFSPNYNGLQDTTDPSKVIEYIEVDDDDSTVTYSICPTDEGTSVSGTVDENDYTDAVSGGTLGVGYHTLVSIIHKAYCQPVTLVKNIMVARKLLEPDYTFTPNLNGKELDDFECLELPSSTATAAYTIKPSTADNGAKISVILDDGTPSSAASQFDGQIGAENHTFKVTVSKDYMISREFTRYIKVDSVLSAPSITFNTPFNGKTEGSYQYIEVENSTSQVTYTASNTDYRDSTLSTVVTNVENGASVSGTNLSVGKYKIVSTVSLPGYTDVSTTKYIAIVTKLKAPTITFNPTFNNCGEDAGHYSYIEVSSTTELVSYTASYPDTSESGVTVTTNVNNAVGNGKLSIGTYEIKVVASKDYHNDVSISRKVKVVLAIQEPTYSFNPGLTTESGNKWIEVPKTNHDVSCTITANASGESLTVKDGTTSISSPANFTLSTLGDHTLTVTVSKENYKTKTFTKTIKIVEELQEPTYSFTPGLTTESGNKWIEVPKTNHDVSCTITANASGESLTVKDGTTSISSPANFTLSTLGDHTLTVTVSKENYTTKTFSKTIKIVEEIQEPTYSFNPGLTSESGNKWIEVPKTNHDVSCKITAKASDEKIKVTEGGTTLYNTGSSPANFTLNTLGDHTLTITVTKDKYKTQTFTKTIKIVEEIQEPTYSFTPGLTTESGNKWIEVPKTNHDVSCKITANASGESLTVKDGTTSISSPANFTLSTLGDHTLTVTVSKENYKTKTFTKPIKIVEELQEPTIKFYKNSSHSTQASSHSSPEDTRFLLYDTYDITLAADGTGYLYYTATTSDGSTITIKDEGTTTTSGKLGLGPHNLTMEVSKTNYVTRTFDTPDKVYVEGKLAPAKIQYSATKSGSNNVWTDMANSTSTQNFMFSYISYDTMPVKVSPGNTGNKIEVSLKNGSTVISSCGKTTDDFTNEAGIGHSDSVYTITVNQSRDYCISSETVTRNFTAKIKPIKLTYEAGEYTDGLQVEVQGFGGDSGNMCIRGEIYVKGPKTDKEIWHFDGANQTVTRNQWSTIIDTDDAYKYWSDTFTSPSNTIQVTFHKFRRDKEGSDIQFSGNDWHSFPALTLSDIKKGKGENSTAGTSWTYVCDIANRSGDCARPKIRFTATE